ncbi:glutamic acid-rich protein-like isoform X1 [Acropora muricata]|uniref:glutamic acid-rich protein-like isoform X1 n=1 Tax=Acropora muricata TaxID=159855 RepID=UPI0034E58C6F
MRLSILLILLVIITICAAKSSKSKSQKATKSNKVFKTKKHKDAEHNDTGKKHKTSSKKSDSKKKIKAHKTADKTSSEISSDKVENKTVAAKSTNMTDSVNTKENNTKAVLRQNPPADCQKIVDDYSNGKILMYEYKIQMGRCLKKVKDGADSADNADVKSDLLRPDATDSVPEEEDSDRAVHVAPASDEDTTMQNEDDYDANRVSDTIPQPEVLKKDNNNDNDYSDDDDDDDDDDADDDDDNYEEEPDEQEDKKMMVPGSLGSQGANVPMMPNTMTDQQQQGMPGQQAAPFYPNMGQTRFSPAPAESPAPVPQQSQAAFAPSFMNQYTAHTLPAQQATTESVMNAEAKSDIPQGSSQPQVPASQVNALFDQWRASTFGATTADKKDQMPSAPAVPANDEFAAFMKMQSASSNSMETTPISQQTAVPAATQQRSDIPLPQQPNVFPMQPQPQAENVVPGQGQAYYVQP